jgi:hypothetical protein
LNREVFQNITFKTKAFKNLTVVSQQKICFFCSEKERDIKLEMHANNPHFWFAGQNQRRPEIVAIPRPRFLSFTKNFSPAIVQCTKNNLIS